MEIREQRREPEARIPAYVLRSEEFAALASHPLALHVLLVLHAHARKDEAWCAQRRLADLTGAWRGSIQRALEHLTEQGWLTRSVRRGKDNRRLADAFKLALPPAVEECRLRVNAALEEGQVGGVDHPLWKKGDLFAYKSGIYPREARIPLSTLTSTAFSALREHGIPMHLWLLLAAYSKGHERIGKRRLADELHVYPSRVSEGLAYLRAQPDLDENGEALPPSPDRYVWISTEKGSTRTEPDKHTVLLIPKLPGNVQAETVPSTATNSADTSDRSKLPPTPLIMRLNAFYQEVLMEWVRSAADGVWVDVPRAWAILVDQGIVPAETAPDPWAGFTVEQASDWLVRAFHRVIRGAEDYDPTVKERRVARDLIRQHGYQAISLIEVVIARMQSTRFQAGNFAAVLRYLPEARRAIAEPS